MNMAATGGLDRYLGISVQISFLILCIRRVDFIRLVFHGTFDLQGLYWQW